VEKRDLTADEKRLLEKAVFAGKMLNKFCRKNQCTAREDTAKYSIFLEMLTGRLREANLKLT